MLGITQILFSFSRKNKQISIVIFDSFAVISSLLIAYILRLGYFYYPADNYYLMFLIFASPILAIPIFFHFGLYREITRYVGFSSLWFILQATTLFSILWGLFALMLAPGDLPRSVVLINWLLIFLLIASSRLFVRWLLSESSRIGSSFNSKNVLIYGAGSAGRQLSKALDGSKEYNPVAFIDDDSNIYRISINGLTVYSQDDLRDLIEKNKIKEVLLAMPLLSRLRRAEIINFLKPYSLTVRSLPSLTKLAQGIVTVNDLLEIDSGDLMDRLPIKPNKNLLGTNIFNKSVLITGAGGSIGSELCRQIIYLKPTKLVLYDISESSLYTIEQELLCIGMSTIEIIPVIGSVIDKDRMKYICNNYEVNTIYHAAAYKHVPLVEFNQSQGILNNTIGTLEAAKAAISANVETFVLISTDKAVRPTNVMGASKRAAELTVQALNKENHSTCFTIVRFGNVIDSSGSVIPLFRKQIKAGGPLTVTHIDVVRYFMTIPEAVELVIQAGALAKGGDVFLLDMGKPIKIYDLAIKMIQLSGLVLKDKSNPKGDIEIQVTGLRPGEKLYEELLISGDFKLTENKLIMRAEEEMIDWDKLEPILIEIEKASKNIDTEKIYKLLRQLVPQFTPQYNSVNEI